MVSPVARSEIPSPEDAMPDSLDACLTAEEHRVLESLDSPYRIQTFLDEIRYPATDRNRCPLNVLRDRQGHCLDGALFAAAALRRLGDPPLLVDMFPDPGQDDDHVLAVFKRNGRLGALAKSNYSTLRYREPVYHSLRELVMSYFDGYFNLYGVRTLRTYTLPLRLAAYDDTGWEWNDSGADRIEKRLLKLKRIPLISTEMAAGLHNVDDLAYKSATLATNFDGVYKPQHRE